jgi:MFS family permease
MHMFARLNQGAKDLWRDHRYTALVFVCCVMQLVTLMSLKTTLVLFIGEIGESTLVAGLLSAVMVICSIIVKPIIGTMLDKKGVKIMMVVVSSLCLITALGHMTALILHSKIVLFFSVAVAGAAYSSLSVTEIPLFLSQAMAPSQEKYMINLVGFNTVLCTAIAPTFSQAVLNRWGFRVLFGLLVLISFLGFFLNKYVFPLLRTMSYAKQEDNQKDTTKHLQITVRLASIVNSKFILLFLSYMTWGVSNGAILSFLIPYGVSVGISSCALFFTVYSVVNILFRWFVPVLMDRFGSRKILLYAYVFLTLGSILLARIRTSLDLILPAILSGFGTSSIYTPLVTQVIEILPQNVRMGGLGIFLVAFEVGQGIAALLIGITTMVMTYSQIFLMIGVIQGVGILTILLSMKHNNKRRINEQ